MVLQDGKCGLGNSKGSGLKAESAHNRHLKTENIAGLGVGNRSTCEYFR